MTEVIFDTTEEIAMKIIRIVLVAGLSFSCIALADVVVPVDEVETYVNIRSAPESSSDVVGRLQQGSSLQHVGTVDGWHEVRLDDDSTGFLSADWSSVVAEAPAAAIVEEVAEATPTEIATEADEVITGDEVNEVDERDIVIVDIDVDDIEATGLVEDSSQEIIEESAVAVAPVEQAAESAVADDLLVDAELELQTDAVDSRDEQTTAAIIEDAGEVSDEVEADTEDTAEVVAGAPTVVATSIVAESVGVVGPPGPVGPQGPPGPAGPSGTAGFEGKQDFIVKFDKPTVGGDSQIYDNGRRVGIGTTEPQQRLEVNGNIQIHASTSNVAGLMITQSSGETGYIMHNRASTLTIGAGSIDRMTIDRAGNVGIGEARPAHPLHMASGARVTAGGVWTNSSSLVNKENIESLTLEDALAALSQLDPVHFNYKNDPNEGHVGFIAEDVPDIVASGDRTGLSPMDIVAVLTKVVQMQQSRIDELELRLEAR